MSDEPVSRFYSSIRLKLHYLDWGNEGAPPLLLLHGGRDHAHNWDWVARALRDDYHISAPDLRGYADTYDLERATATAIGPTCHICERVACPDRSLPPVTRSLELHPLQRSVSPYPFRQL